ncbi:sensor histidine kinase [Flavobacterium sp.]|uniref:sensor histidine kinase n=1 Tax=Flavobacterium sp. TaxID=239 RepID=UPI00334223D1
MGLFFFNIFLNIEFIIELIFFFIALSFIVSYVYLGYKFKKIVKENIYSSNLQCKLNKSIKEKELLLKELHHRVKNNLQIIVSILNIQARISKNQQIDSFIEKCETRIKSMLYIHEMLCISDDVSKVNFNEYTLNLIHNIYTTFDIKHIKYKVKMEVVEFDIETAIPLGLIINELINNSFKYAFVDRKSGEINISLKSINENSYILTVSDNGVGFDVYSKKFGSIGLDIVKLFVDQMSGKFRIKSDDGVTCVILFHI